MILVLLLAALSCLTVHGWWDEGHMIVAAVAKLSADAEEMQVLEEVLSLWNFDYPGMSNISVAATWSDHVKCSSGIASHCKGLPAVDSVFMFNTWHYSTVPYNQGNVALPPEAQLCPDLNSAHCILDTIGRSLRPPPPGKKVYPIDQCSNTKCKRSSGASYVTPDVDLDETTGSDFYDQRELAAVADAKDIPVVGSVTSWNLMLRIYIHVYGDIHQPCHACTAYSTRLPNGDAGGNLVALEEPVFTANNLHALWDSAGGAHRKSWPVLSADEAENIARSLMNSYPKSTFVAELAKAATPYDIAMESNQIAIEHVYKELFDTRWPKFGKYKPSVAYIQNAQEVSEARMVLGGYRLAAELESFAPFARSFLKHHKARSCGTRHAPMAALLLVVFGCTWV